MKKSHLDAMEPTLLREIREIRSLSKAGGEIGGGGKKFADRVAKLVIAEGGIPEVFREGGDWVCSFRWPS